MNKQEAYECPEHGKALILYLLQELQRVYWNIYQRPLNEFVPIWLCGDIQYRFYREEQTRPNLSYQSVEIEWYKHPGRGMETNIEMDEVQWVSWFTACLAQIHEVETKYLIAQGLK